jgi:hypothetical protein
MFEKYWDLITGKHVWSDADAERSIREMISEPDAKIEWFDHPEALSAAIATVVADRPVCAKLEDRLGLVAIWMQTAPIKYRKLDELRGRNSWIDDIPSARLNLTKILVDRYAPCHNVLFGLFDATFICSLDYMLGSGSMRLEPDAFQHVVNTICYASTMYDTGDTIMVARRPDLCLDSQGRLHNETGPAVKFPGGRKYWWIHGVEVDEKTVMDPKSITISEINACYNMETKRIMIDRKGWRSYFKESGAVPVDRRHNDRDNQIEELYSTPFFHNLFLCRDPSTGRRYALPVPSHVQDCQQAQDFMHHGLDVYMTHRS